jgi:COP9 signalosome complex subunit 1
MSQSANNNAVGDAGIKKDEKEKKEIIQVVINPEDFDLEGYINNYSGHTKIARLVFIAEHCKALELDAFRMAIDELKKTMNTTLYKNLLEKVGEQFGFPLDNQWIDSTEKKVIALQERLELELNGYKTNLVKESIRVRNPTISN